MRRLPVLALVLAVLLTACGTPAKSAGPTPPAGGGSIAPSPRVGTPGASAATPTITGAAATPGAGATVATRAPVTAAGRAAGPTWTPAPALSVPRDGCTATALPDGTVLVVGGEQGAGLTTLATAERFDPATNRWSAAGAMSSPREGHAAALLPDGRVLVTGGRVVAGGGGPNRVTTLQSAERYDPAAGLWTPVAPMLVPRAFHTATALRDGRILVAGGDERGSAEVYDPAADRWSPAGALRADVGLHTVTPLPDGGVLVLGGLSRRAEAALPLAERYDPASNAWAPAAPMSVARATHTATLLPDGTVLVIGGANDRNGGDDEPPLASVARYDPATDRWTEAAPLAAPRYWHTATLLPGGQVLVAGAAHAATPAAAERYDPATDRWSPAGTPAAPRRRHVAAPLPDGRVLVAGGGGGDGRTALASAEVYADGPAAPFSGDPTPLLPTRRPAGPPPTPAAPIPPAPSAPRPTATPAR